MRSVAIQGIKGSYSEEAALKLFGNTARIEEFSSFFETFQALLVKSVDYAVIPLKNTIIGEISTAVEFFNQTDLEIIDELPLDIRHALIGTNEASLDEIKTVRSHIEALKQCGQFFSENQNIRQIIGSDTASSIRRIIADDLAENAAIGSLRAAEIYGGKVLAENIADEITNQTFFYLMKNRLELY